MKCFIKVRQTFTPRHELNQLILDNINPLDCTIYPDIETAQKAIQYAYNQAIESYSETGKSSHLQFSDDGKKAAIREVMYISLYPVRNS